jgi:hypothetical protein
VYGLIFLFKWQPDLKTNKPAIEENAPVYFAQQIINNACATQAMLSILLNQSDTELEIGEQLKQLRVRVHTGVLGLVARYPMLSNTQEINQQAANATLSILYVTPIFNSIWSLKSIEPLASLCTWNLLTVWHVMRLDDILSTASVSSG